MRQFSQVGTLNMLSKQLVRLNYLHAYIRGVAYPPPAVLSNWMARLDLELRARFPFWGGGAGRAVCQSWYLTRTQKMPECWRYDVWVGAAMADRLWIVYLWKGAR